MSNSPNPEDDAWYARIDCPRYFDFSAALQAPCSVDLEYNPPLHDFVYQSDEESNDFFRRARASPPSPHPKRTQQRMLDPRHFGNPIYRHRPQTTFEEFLRQYQQRRGKQTKSSQAVLAASEKPSHHSLGSPHSPPLSSPHLGSRTDRDGTDVSNDLRSFNKADTVIPMVLDRPVTLKTPSVASDITTPVSNRRRAQQYTPSRLRNPSHVVKSLFFTPSSPSPSPLRKARRNLQGPPLKSSDTPQQPLPSPLRLTPKYPNGSAEAPAKVSSSSAVNVTVRPPARTTPPTNPGSSISSVDSNPRSTAVLKSAAIVNRRDKSTPDAPGLPRRAIRPFGSNDSSLTVTPPTQSTHQDGTDSASKSSASGPQPAASSANEKRSDIAVPDTGRSPGPQSQRQNVNTSFQVPGEPREERKEAADDETEIDDPDLLRILKEHNRRLRKSGRHVPKDILDEFGETESQTEIPPRAVKEGNDAETGTESNDNAAPPVTQVISQAASKGKEGQGDFERRSGRSLQALLSSRNDRVLQDRKQRLPERAKLIKLNKEIVLQRMDRPKAAPQERASAKVDFTPSQPGLMQNAKSHHSKAGSSGSSIQLSVDTSKKGNGHIATRMQQRRGKVIRGRTKSIVENADKNNQNGKSNVPIPRPASSSRLRTRTASDRIKANERDKRKQERAERDLNSLLSQHNSKVQNKRRGQA